MVEKGCRSEGAEPQNFPKSLHGSKSRSVRAVIQSNGPHVFFVVKGWSFVKGFVAVSRTYQEQCFVYRPSCFFGSQRSHVGS